MPLLAQTELDNKRAQQPALFCLRRRVDAERVSTSPVIDRRDESSSRTVVAGAAATAATVTQSKAAEELGENTSSSTREDTYGEAEAMAADERRSSPPSPFARDAGPMSFHRRTARQRQAFSSEQSSFGHMREESSSRDTSGGWRLRQHTEGHHVAASSSLFIDDNCSGSSSPAAPAYEPLPLTKASATAEIPGPYVMEARQKELFGGSRVEDTKQEQRQRLDATAALAKVDSLTHDGEKPFIARVAGLSSSHHQEVREKSRADQDHGSRQVPAVPSLEGEKPPSPTIDRKDFLSTVKRSDKDYASVREDLLRYMEGVRAR